MTPFFISFIHIPLVAGWMLAGGIIGYFLCDSCCSESDGTTSESGTSTASKTETTAKASTTSRTDTNTTAKASTKTATQTKAKPKTKPVAKYVASATVVKTLSKEEKKKEVLSNISSRKGEVNFKVIGIAKSNERDDLKVISGIGPYFEEKLNALDIYTFLQISKFTPKIAEKVAEVIEFFPGRIQRDDWVGQAKKLTK